MPLGRSATIPLLHRDLCPAGVLQCLQHPPSFNHPVILECSPWLSLALVTMLPYMTLPDPCTVKTGMLHLGLRCFCFLTREGHHEPHMQGVILTYSVLVYFAGPQHSHPDFKKCSTASLESLRGEQTPFLHFILPVSRPLVISTS